MIQIQMETTLHDELVNALYSVPVLQTRPGRDSLLISIPGHNKWNRINDNDFADLSVIVDYLKHTFSGDTEEEGTWALLGFIDRALRAVDGTSKAKDLRDLRGRCVQCLEKILSKQVPPIIVDTFTATTNIIFTKNASEPPDSNIPLSITTRQKVILPDQNLNFFEGASTCLIEARQNIIEVYTFFDKQLFVYVTPAQKRKAIVCLEIAVQQFEMLLQLLHGTILLPEEVASHHQLFVDQINYLIEQFQMLIDWITIDKVADSALQESLSRIKKALKIFMVIDSVKGTPDSHHD